MNKQELIKQIKKLFVFGVKDYIERDEVLVLVEQLDEPKKVVVPQFVADWIEECKKKGDLSLGGAIQLACPEIYEWIREWDNQETFALAWIFGYEVEKEKRYWVKLKAVDQYLISVKDEKFLGFLQSKLRSKFTRKELEDLGFGWVFDCPGIEIEEVEE